MSTFGAMRNRIETEMVRGDITASATIVKAAIVDAIDYFASRPTWFNEFTNSAHITVASSDWVTLSASLNPVMFTTVKIRIGTNREYPLDAESFEALDRIDASQYEGYPEVYSYYGSSSVRDGTDPHGKLRLYPTPNAEYTLLMSGVYRLPEISLNASASAANAWTVAGEQVIRLQAKGNLFRDYIRNAEAAGAFYGQAEEHWKALMKQARGLKSTRRVRRYRW